IGLAERSYQRAVEYAAERRQGRAPGAPKGEKSYIIEHPDVRRNLLAMKAYTEAARAMAYTQAEYIDLAKYAADEAARTEADEIDTLQQATDWVFGNGLTDPLEALAAATPYQRMFATTVAGWLMARAALAATALLAGKSGDADFLEAKVVTARYFAEHLLPQV